MRRLYRSRTNRVFTGVIGGIGEYFGVDPVIIRLCWILLVISTGLVPGIITYIIAAVMVPSV